VQPKEAFLGFFGGSCLDIFSGLLLNRLLCLPMWLSYLS
jgi:hypothetical protein